VPKALYILVSPIELVTDIFSRPLSLAVRLFANMLAGHLLLITFSVISAALFAVQVQIVILPFSFFLLVALTGFEVLVAFLQAFIFTILTAVYVGGAMNPEH
jgi:F-type H+-transporting ATPase subunit a